MTELVTPTYPMDVPAYKNGTEFFVFYNKCADALKVINGEIDLAKQGNTSALDKAIGNLDPIQKRSLDIQTFRLIPAFGSRHETTDLFNDEKAQQLIEDSIARLKTKGAKFPENNKDAIKAFEPKNNDAHQGPGEIKNHPKHHAKQNQK